MPLNLNAASPVGVLPKMFYTSFSESRIYPTLVANHKDGRIERSLITDTVNPATSIITWNCSVRLCSYLRTGETLSQLATLRKFFEDHYGNLIPFYFYNPKETDPIGEWDESGTETTGRHIVRFTNNVWSEEITINMGNVSFGLQECN